MSKYLDADTIDQCHQALRDGVTLDDLAGKLHCDTDAWLSKLANAAQNAGGDR